MADYRETVDYILGIPLFAQKIGKENLSSLLCRLGNPEKAVPAIHVAGTNGKGSTCRALAQMLAARGYRVGLFISPHLVSINERIQINGTNISDDDFVSAFETVKGQFREHPSFFEVMFAMAAVYFRQQKCDFAVEKIAYEKAGIIKPGVPVIYFRRDEAAARVIEDTAKERGADIIPVEKSDYIINHLGNKTIDFSLHNRYYSYCNLQIQKTSLYQVENVSLAVTAFRMLMERRNVPEQDIEKTVRNALLQFYWEGRMEEIAPHIYVDGAHNVEAVNAYIETMNRLHGEYDKILVFAAVKDKEYDSMIHLLAGNITFGRIIVTSVDSSRKADSAKLAEIFSACTDTPVMVSDEIDDAMDMAVELRGDRENTNIYCVGSLYLVGGVKRWRNRHDQF